MTTDPYPEPAPPDSIEFETSPNVGAIGEALAAAQGEIRNAQVDSENPHFRSKFTSLAGVIDAVREPLAKHKIARPQFLVTRGEAVGIKTVLIHASGQWIAGTAWCAPERPGPQAMGSVTTYLRRYSLAAVTGLAQDDDDDAEGAEKPRAAPRPKTPKLDSKVQARIKILQDECGIEDREWREKLAYHYGVESSAELSAEQAQDLIYRLTEVKRTKVGTAPQPATSAPSAPKSEGQG